MKKKYEAPKLINMQIKADYILIGPTRIQLHTEDDIVESNLPNLFVVEKTKKYE